MLFSLDGSLHCQRNRVSTAKWNSERLGRRAHSPSGPTKDNGARGIRVSSRLRQHKRSVRPSICHKPIAEPAFSDQKQLALDPSFALWRRVCIPSVVAPAIGGERHQSGEAIENGRIPRQASFRDRAQTQGCSYLIRLMELDKHEREDAIHTDVQHQSKLRDANCPNTRERGVLDGATARDAFGNSRRAPIGYTERDFEFSSI